jgi:ABC-type sugar transport system substrate-binding protein
MKRLFLLALVVIFLCVSTIAFSVSKEKEEGIMMIWMPKLLGIDYFNSCLEGAEAAADELGITLKEDAPIEADVTKQIELIDNYITQGVDIIALAANDPVAISPVLKKAQNADIHVVTWDADADYGASGRPLFINQTSYELFGRGFIKLIARDVGESAKIGIVTSFFTAPNQSKWIEWMKVELEENYPNMELVDIREGEEDQTVAFRVAQDMMKAYPEMDALIGLASTVLPGCAEAAKQMGKVDELYVTGGSTPNLMKKYIKDGSSDPFLLWNTFDLGYLTVYAAKALYDGEITGAEGETFKAGKMGTFTIGANGEVVMGPPFEFNSDNIDDFNF